MVDMQTWSVLEKGWDSYDADPPNFVAIAHAKTFLKFLIKNDIIPTRVRPSVIGGVGITFRAGTAKIYIEFHNKSRILILLPDLTIMTVNMSFLLSQEIIDIIRELPNAKPG